MKRLKNILMTLMIIFFIFIGLWVAQDNPQAVAISLLGFPLGEIPLGFGLVSVLALGVLVGILSSLPVIVRLRAENRRLKQRL